MVRSGRMRFTAQARRNTTTDNLGKKQKDFVTSLGTFRCDLVDLGASEVDYGEGVSTLNTWEVHARWEAINQIGLKENDRLIVDGKTLNISGIRNEANRDRRAIITAEEIR